MRKLSYSVFMLIIVPICHLTAGELIDVDDAATINRFEPSDLQGIKDAIAKGDEATELSQFINLADRIDGQFSGPKAAVLTASQANDLNFLCRAIWNTGIKIYSTLTQDPEKEKFLSFWKSSLRKPSAHIQVATLGDTMNRDLMTPELWALLQGTNDPSTMEAFAYVVSRQGNENDAKQLEQKIALVTSSKYKEILENGITYRNYRLTGSPRPGPPTPGPSPF